MLAPRAAMNTRLDSLRHPVETASRVAPIEASSRHEDVCWICRGLDRGLWWTQRGQHVTESGPPLTGRIQLRVRKSLSHSVAHGIVDPMALPVIVLEQRCYQGIPAVGRLRPAPVGLSLGQPHDEKPRPVLCESEVGRIQ